MRSTSSLTSRTHSIHDMDELDLMTDAMQTELAMPSVLLELSDQSLTEGSL